MLDNLTHHATSMGTQAYHILLESHQFVIRGVTSRGVFLDSTNGWIVFLSREKYRGPLTINIPEPFSTIKFIVKETVDCANGLLRLGKANPTIDTTSAEIFSTRDLLADQNQKLILSLRLQDLQTINVNHPLNEKLIAVNTALQNRNWQEIENSCTTLFGQGSGLTPEGDDFVLGLLYTLYQTTSDIKKKNFQTMTDRLIRKAYQKTTTLSANLIECAALGEVDERIYSAFGAITTYTFHQEEAIQELLGWGNTSGKMVLAGMVSGLEHLIS